jgi:hypothetical protein
MHRTGARGAGARPRAVLGAGLPAALSERCRVCPKARSSVRRRGSARALARPSTPLPAHARYRPCRKVFERLKDDFASKRRDRVARLDVPMRIFDPASSRAPRGIAAFAGGTGSVPGPPDPGVVGLEEWDAALRDALRAGFEARQAGYDAEVCGGRARANAGSGGGCSGTQRRATGPWALLWRTHLVAA